MSYRFSPAKLRELRRRSGLPAEAVALRVGRTVGSLFHWESGRARPSLAVIERLATALAAKPGDFFEDDGTTEPVEAA